MLWTKPISGELWKFIVLGKKVLVKAYRPDGFNVGMNIGRPAGAGIEEHLHVHIIPRWNGDNNFMPVMNDTRIISQGLGDTYDCWPRCLDSLTERSRLPTEAIAQAGVSMREKEFPSTPLREHPNGGF